MSETPDIKRLNGMIVEVTEDRTYDGLPLEEGDVILLGKANVFVMTPFLNVDRGRDRGKEWMLSRFYPAKFTPGKPVIVDGCFGPKGHGATYDPFFEPMDGGKNSYLELEVRHRQSGGDEFVVDDDATQQLVSRRDHYVELLQAAAGKHLPTVQGPFYWAAANEGDADRLNLDVPAVMEYAYHKAQSRYRKLEAFEVVMNDEQTSDEERELARTEAGNVRTIVLPEDDDWNETFKNSTSRGWESFWTTACENFDQGEFFEVEPIVHCLLPQITTIQEGSIWVPLQLLASTELVTNVYVEKSGPKVFWLDRPPHVYNRIAHERDLATMLAETENKWRKRVEAKVAEGVDASVAEAEVEKQSGKTLAGRLHAVKGARRHASALICETPVLKQQLWFTKGRSRTNAGIRKSLGVKGLRTRYGGTPSVQGVKRIRQMAETGHRGGLDA